MIALERMDFISLRYILQKYPYIFYAYGSRVKGRHRKFSDLDLCIMEAISDDELEHLREDLEESDLSIKVDVKRWSVDMNEDFRNLIKQDLERIEI